MFVMNISMASIFLVANCFFSLYSVAQGTDYMLTRDKIVMSEDEFIDTRKKISVQEARVKHSARFRALLATHDNPQQIRDIIHEEEAKKARRYDFKDLFNILKTPAMAYGFFHLYCFNYKALVDSYIGFSVFGMSAGTMLGFGMRGMVANFVGRVVFGDEYTMQTIAPKLINDIPLFFKHSADKIQSFFTGQSKNWGAGQDYQCGVKDIGYIGYMVAATFILPKFLSASAVVNAVAATAAVAQPMFLAFVVAPLVIYGVYNFINGIIDTTTLKSALIDSGIIVGGVCATVLAMTMGNPIIAIGVAVVAALAYNFSDTIKSIV